MNGSLIISVQYLMVSIKCFQEINKKKLTKDLNNDSTIWYFGLSFKIMITMRRDTKIKKKNK